jgi:hypothetical protein
MVSPGPPRPLGGECGGGRALAVDRLERIRRVSSGARRRRASCSLAARRRRPSSRPLVDVCRPDGIRQSRGERPRRTGHDAGRIETERLGPTRGQPGDDARLRPPRPDDGDGLCWAYPDNETSRKATHHGYSARLPCRRLCVRSCLCGVHDPQLERGNLWLADAAGTIGFDADRNAFGPLDRTARAGIPMRVTAVRGSSMVQLWVSRPTERTPPRPVHADRRREDVPRGGAGGPARVDADARTRVCSSRPVGIPSCCLRPEPVRRALSRRSRRKTSPVAGTSWSPSTTPTRHVRLSSRAAGSCAAYAPTTLRGFIEWAYFGVEVRVRDTRFALDRLTALNRHGRLAGRLDLAHIGMVGHSLGGGTAAEVMLVDQRVDAAVDLDGPITPNVVRHGLDRPFMVINAPPEPPSEAVAVHGGLRPRAWFCLEPAARPTLQPHPDPIEP